MKVWSYTVINWDILSDDQDDALGIPTRFAFKTMEQAKKAADETYRDSFEAAQEAYSPLEWEPDLNGDHGDLRADTLDKQETYLVYGMEVVEE